MAEWNEAQLERDLDADWEATAALDSFQRDLPLPDDWKRRFWAWYEAHTEDVVLQKGIWFFQVTVRVKHLKPVFEAIFGPEAGSPQESGQEAITAPPAPLPAPPAA